MEAIILAGGLGTRLQNIVPDVPKPMAPIAGRPFLEIMLGMLAQKGFTRAVLSLGFMANKVVAHFGERFAGIDLVYAIEKSPLGTGGALRQALTQCKSDHVFVFNGDTLLDLEVMDVENHWQRNHAPIIVARRVPDTARYGRLEVDGQRITGFSEKTVAGPGLISAGCYVVPKNLLGEFALGQPFSLETDFLVAAVKAQRFDYFVSKGYFIDIGSPDDYADAQMELTGFISTEA